MLDKNQHEMKKNKTSRKVFGKSIILGLIFDAKMGDLEEQKQTVRIIHFSKSEVSAFREKCIENERQKGSEMISKTKGSYFLVFEEVVGEV